MKNKNKINDLLKRVEKIEKYISDNTEVVVELTELPEKWCIKLINSEKLLDWVNKNSNENILFDDMVENPIRYLFFHYPSDVNPFKGIPVRLKDNLYTEITFDQFKKWVLKEDESKVFEYDHLKEIDWSKSGQLVVDPPKRTYILTDGKQTENFFSGMIVGGDLWNIGRNDPDWCKFNFKLCTEPITLSN